MSWILANQSIHAPQDKQVDNDVQEVIHRTLNGTYSRDFVGVEKKIITCDYDPISDEDYQIIRNAYLDQFNSGASKNLTINEDGLTFNGNVIIRLSGQSFNLPNIYSYKKVKIIFIEV